MSTTDATAGSVPPRSALPKEKTWNLESVYPNADAWEKGFQDALNLLPTIAKYQGHLADSATSLYEALTLRDRIYREAERVIVYAYLRYSEDAGNGANAALVSRAGGLEAQAGAAVSFVDPELLTIDAATIDRFMREEPRLEQYRFALADLERQKAHVRSAEVEAVLAQAGEIASAPATISSTLTDNDLQFGTIIDENGNTVQLAQGNVEKYLSSTDPAVRRAAWTAAADAHLAFANTLAETLQTGIKKDVFYARARNFETALTASLSPTNLPESVFHNLIATVRKNYPTWHRFFRVRRKLLGVETLHPGDLHAPLGTNAPEIGWEAGVRIILDTLAPMGDEYVGIVRKGLTDRWVDVLPNQGKGSGAFSAGSYDSMPFISMNWHDDLGSVSTLTHELGHSVHSYHTRQSQPITYAQYSMSSAETASNFHQALMGRYLLDHHDEPEWVLAILEERMANHLRYFFIMPILAQFEYWMHTEIENGQALTADRMNDKLADLFIEGYGGEVAISDDDRPRLGVTWAQFQHMYMNYYVFQYAVGISAAAALSKQVLEGGAPVVERYRNFLREGGSSYPIDQLKAAGIDMSSPEPVQAAFDILAGYVDRLEQLAGGS